MRNIFLLLHLFTAATLWAQTPEKKLEEYGRNYPMEKVLLQFSKPEYIAGETIHFKAYVLTGNEPSSLSTNLYAELYDKDKNRLDSQMIYLSQGSGEGGFSLPAHLAEDVYYIRAYTRWMLNFEEAFQTIKAIPVYNPYSSQSLRIKPVQWTVRAFVEGGILLDSAVANVAVRLFSQGRLPASWTGTLVEAESNTTVAEVTVYNNEVGQVRFIAHRGKTYKFLLKDNLGTTQEIPLPPVQSSGALLQASVYENKLRYSILLKDLPNSGTGYKLVATINNQPVFVASVMRSAGGVARSIDTKDWPPGVLQLTLFDENQTPLAERLCFLHHDALPITEPALTPHTLALTTRGRNHWTVETDSLRWSSFAVQVTDASFQPSTDFISSIYLTSNVQSPVHQAGWYFQNITPEKTAALDALLLTEKWKWYHWPTILRKQFPPFRFQPEQLLSFSGTVLKGNKPQPRRDINLLFRAADSSLSFVQVKTDDQGRFALQDFFFTDSLQVYYQPDKRRFLEGDLTVQLTPHQSFHSLQGVLPTSAYTTALREKTDTLPVAVQKALAQRQQEMLRAEREKMLEAVVVTTQTRTLTQQLDEQLSSELFKSGHARVFDFVNTNSNSLSAYNNVLEWLQGRVPGLTLSRGFEGVTPYIRNTPATVYLDEMMVSAETLSSVPAQDIAMIKVFNGGLMTPGGGGSIAIYTRRGNLSTSNQGPGLQQATLRGYKRQPMPPAYDHSQDEAVKDERLILFYRTILPPEPSAAKTAVEFYNNDSTRQFRLVITGFTHEGKPVYLNKVVE